MPKLRSLIRRFAKAIWKREAAPSERPLRLAPQPVRVGRRGERGQALIEFAFVTPILLLFMLVIFDFGLALDHRETIQHDVREGARRGAIGASVAEIKQAAGNDPGKFDVTVCYVDKNGNGVPGNAGDSVRVSGHYVYKFTVGSGELLSVFGVNPGGLSITMTPVAESRLERTVTGATACP